MSYVITIDGPAGAGKSSVAKILAKKLGINYLDTGAIYRAIALILNSAEIKSDDELNIREALNNIKIELQDGKIFVNDLDVSSEIRTPEADKLASEYSAVPAVREALLNLQRVQIFHGSLIAEGRDVGSVVFPDAELKFFITASPEVRAKRRFEQRKRKGLDVNYNEILNAINSRDDNDSHRRLSPLKVPENAIYIDTSEMSQDQVINKILNIVAKKELN